MRKLLLSSVAASAVIALSTSAAEAAGNTLVWSSMGSPKNPIVRCGPGPIAKRIAEITGHKEEAHLGNAAFANPRRQYGQLSRAITDFSWGVMSFTPGRFPMAEVLTLPFVSADNKAAAKSITALRGTYPALVKETGDIHLLAIAAAGPYQVHLKQPLESLTSLKGLRIRTTGTPLSKSVKALGGDVVAMPTPQVYENMQKGVIDGYLGTNASLVAFRLNEVTGYHILTNISASLIFTGLSKKYFDGLPAAQRSQIDKELGGPDAAVRYSSCWDKVDKIGLGLAKKRGNTIRDMTPAEEAAVRKKLQPVTEEYLADLEKRGLPAKAFYKDLVAEIAKNKGS